MEYTITKTKWQHGDISEEFVERFEGTPQEIVELLKLTNGMGEDREIKKFTTEVKKDSNIFTIDNIEEFKKGGIAVNCRSEILARKFLNGLKDEGLKWCNNESLDGNSQWDVYKKHTCYSNDSSGLSFANLEHFEYSNYKIKEFRGW